MAPRKKIPGKSHEKDKDPMHCCGGGGDSRGEYLNRLREKAKTNCKLPCTVEGCSTHRDSYSRWCGKHRMQFSTYGTTDPHPTKWVFQEYWPDIKGLLALNPDHSTIKQTERWLRTKAAAGGEFSAIFRHWLKFNAVEDFITRVASVFTLFVLDEARRWLPCERAIYAHIGHLISRNMPYVHGEGRCRPKTIPQLRWKYLGAEVAKDLGKVMWGVAGAVRRRRLYLEELAKAGKQEWRIDSEPND